MNVIALLLLAAGVNIAIACGSAVLAYPTYTEERQIFTSRPEFPKWILQRGTKPTAMRCLWWHDPIALPGQRTRERQSKEEVKPPSWSNVVWSETEGEESIFCIVEDAHGWPELSLASWSRLELEPFAIAEHRLCFALDNAAEAGATLSFPNELWTFRVVPLRPIWPGFAINTIFYAAILWVVFFAPGMVKRVVRRRRGLCPACAYPIGSSEVCTECGMAVKQKAESQKAEMR